MKDRRLRIRIRDNDIEKDIFDGICSPDELASIGKKIKRKYG